MAPPLKGIDTRGCKLKPSSVLSTSMSAQSLGRVTHDGFGRLTRTPVRWLGSANVKRSLGNGPRAGELRSNRACTPAASATTGTTSSRTRTKGRLRRNDVIGVASSADVHCSGDDRNRKVRKG